MAVNGRFLAGRGTHMQPRKFLPRALAESAGFTLVPGGRSVASGSASAQSAPTEVDQPFLDVLTTANTAQVPRVLDTYAEALVAISPRGTARSVRRLTSAYVWSQSSHYHDPALLGPLQEMASALEAAQNEDGTYDQGNLHSPPDSAFTLRDLCMIYTLLRADGLAATTPITDALERIIRAAGPALAQGGLHTPNHRWVLCAALARIHHLWPHRSYVERVDAWLSEEIDIDREGQYSERSATYASVVTNPSLLTIALLLDKPQLLRLVRRNLEATLYLLEPNGEVETVHSRRQDQTRVRDVWWYLLQYRELALRDGNGQFAAVVQQILQRGVGELGDFLAEVLERPELAAPSPPVADLPEEYTTLFRGAALARLRRSSITASIFGGTDFHAIPLIASGLSTNPTFFKFRKGAAILDSVRLSPQFFSTGHFRSDGLEAHGSTYRLGDTVEVPYHLPLPRRFRRADGDYALTNDGRFYSKMDFPHRPKQLRVLRTEINITEVDGGFEVRFSLEESEVPWTIELSFRRGGVVAGVEPASGTDNYQLVDGVGSYTVGSDSITFGPGNGAGPLQPVNMDPGERYTHLGGSLIPDGIRVYITGRSPGQYVLTLR